MDITAIPFNKLIGLKNSDDERYLLMLPECERYANHLGTVHASALFSLAEATSGVLLLNELGGGGTVGRGDDDNCPEPLEAPAEFASVVRKVETKYRNPAHGAVFSTATLSEDNRLLLSELRERGRSFAHVTVELFDGVAKSDAESKPVAQFEFEWFITKIKK